MYDRWLQGNKLFSGYVWYTFHYKTQIKNFRYIYFAQLRQHQDDTDLYDLIFIVIKVCVVYQAYPEKIVSPSTIIVSQLYRKKYRSAVSQNEITRPFSRVPINILINLYSSKWTSYPKSLKYSKILSFHFVKPMSNTLFCY